MRHLIFGLAVFFSANLAHADFILFSGDHKDVVNLEINDGLLTGSGLLSGRWEPESDSWSRDVATYDGIGIHLASPTPKPGSCIILIASMFTLLICRRLRNSL